MPTIALILWGVFVLYLLKIPGKLHPGVSRASWLPTVWLTYFSSKTFSDWLLRSGRNPELGILLEQLLLLILAFLAISVLVRRGFNLSRLFNNNTALMVLFALILISILWSDVPFSSIKRVGREGLAIIMGMLIFLEEDAREAIQCVLRRTIYLLVPLSFVLIKWFPQYGSDYHLYTGKKMWIGACGHKNSLGQLVSIAVFFIFWNLVRNKNRANRQGSFLQLAPDALILVMALWILKGPGWTSATSIIMLSSGMFCYLMLLWMKKRLILINPRILAFVMIMIMVYGTLIFLINLLPSNSITSIVGRKGNMTERNVIWAGLVPVALRKPILGHGFGGKWISLNTSQIGFSPHNGYLEVMLGLGFCGLFLTGAYIISLSLRAQKELRRQYDWGALWISCLLMLLLHNIAESSINTFTNLFSAIQVWLMISSNAIDDSRPKRASPSYRS